MPKLSNTLIVLPYDPNWITEFERIRDYLMEQIGEMNTYRKAIAADIDTIAHFGQLLYSSDNTLDKLREETDEHLRSGKWAVFLEKVILEGAQC